MVRRAGPTSARKRGMTREGAEWLRSESLALAFRPPSAALGQGRRALPGPEWPAVRTGWSQGSRPLALGERGPWQDPVRLSGKFCGWPSGQQWARDVTPVAVPAGGFRQVSLRKVKRRPWWMWLRGSQGQAAAPTSPPLPPALCLSRAALGRLQAVSGRLCRELDTERVLQAQIRELLRKQE